MRKSNWQRPFFLLAIVFSVVGFLSLTACNSKLDPAGAYAGDEILYAADQTLVTAYDVIDTFLQYEHTNRANLSGNIHEAAESMRKSAPGWFQSATALRAAYAQDPTPANRLKLSNAIGILRAAMTEATKYMIASKKLAVYQPLFLRHRLAI